MTQNLYGRENVVFTESPNLSMCLLMLSVNRLFGIWELKVKLEESDFTNYQITIISAVLL